MSIDFPTLRLPSARAGRCSWELCVQTAHPLDAPAAARIGAVLQTLAEAANHGAFPLVGSPPAASRLALGGQHLDAQNMLVVLVEADNFDPRGFELLRCMAERLVRQEVLVRAIAIGERGHAWQATARPAPDDDGEYEAYPPRSSLVRFEVLREPLDDSRSRRAVVDLVDAVRPGDVEQLSAWLRPWQHLLDAGAFAQPVGLPSQTESVAGATTLFDERAIEVSVNRFRASECAWDVLANMIDACWPDVRRVSKLMID